MKSKSLILQLLLLAMAPLLVNCKSLEQKPAATRSSNTAKVGEKSGQVVKDDLDEYAATEISDPLEGLNRVTFWCNDQLYCIIFRPISKGYEKALPKPVRNGIDNVFENVKFPVRFVNSALQGRFKRAGQETEKFLVNTVIGFGGIIRQSDKIASLTDVPAEDTGLTFAKWGAGHGAYIVLPLLGPSSVRDGVGLAGDYALNPVNWGLFWRGKHDWTIAPPSANTLRSLPAQFSVYDAACKDALDPYISLRSAYIQNRAEAGRK